MRDFYSKLATGKLTKAEALRQVQIDFLKGDRTTRHFTELDESNRADARRAFPEKPTQNSFEHPYYWAPFILIGNNL